MLSLFRKMSGAKKPAGKKPAKNSANKKKASKGFSMDLSTMRQAMKMVSGFTVLRMTSMTGMLNISFTKEELLAMNSRLNRIRRAD